ncbi:hypothetical protein SDJN02_16319, partial [Cucurbita argyrosperma subsp. argyrosperma]
MSSCCVEVILSLTSASLLVFFCNNWLIYIRVNFLDFQFSVVLFMAVSCLQIIYLVWLLQLPWLAVFSNIHSSLRRQKVTEAKFLEKETAKRLEEAIRKKVEASLNDDDVKVEINRKMEEGRRRLNEEVAAQLEKEKEAALIEAQRKEEEARKEKEEVERMVEERRRRVEEAQRSEALERQQREEERYRELEELQRKKEEAIKRKKQEEEEQRLNQMKLLGKNKSRPKLSFAIGSK